METALARQLKKLAVPQTTVLLNDKIKKSFLFDHRDAAGLDQEVIFAIGTTGLQKLCAINPMFSKFDNDLFNLTSKDFQRSVQTSSVNKKLDNKISEFLRMLSPYFLIRDAHEALEWLVYRFRINLYNVDELIASALPYYNTAVFVRVVQLLDLDETSRWFWLEPIQKTGVYLEYSAILNRFLSDLGFRKFVCDISTNVLDVFKCHKTISTVAMPIISFSMLTIYNAIEVCKSVDDKFLTSLFPYICHGLLSNISKYTSASYMVFSKLLLKIKLTPEIAKIFLIKIFETLKVDLTKAACEILLLTFQCQSIKFLPKKVYFVISSNAECTSTLFSLLNNFKAFSLIRAIIKRAMCNLFNIQIYTKMNDVENMSFLKNFLNSVLLEEKCVLLIFNLTIKRLSECYRDNIKCNKKLNKYAKCIFKNLEQKYPDHFDKAFRKFLKEKSEPNKDKISSLISNSVCNLKYEIVPDVKTSLSVGLYHANPDVRQTSVICLLNLITEKKIDNEFIGNSLYERLFDKDPNVILAVLSYIDIVLKIINKEKMLSAFENIFARKISLKSDWYPVHMKCLDIVIRSFSDSENAYDVLQIILNFIFPVNKHSIKGFLYLLDSNIENDFLQELKSLKQDFGKIKDITNKQYTRINYMVVECLRKSISKINEGSRMIYISFLNSKISDIKSNSVVVFYIYTLEFMLKTSEDENISLLLVNSLLQILKYYFSEIIVGQDKFEILSEECVISKCIDSLNNKRFPSILIFSTFHKICTELELDIECNTYLNECDYGISYEILSKLFDFCILYINSDRRFLQEYFNSMLSLLISSQLKTMQIAFWFFSTKWFSNSENFILQYTSMSSATALCHGKNKIDWLFDDSMIFFSILKAIANPSSKLSHTAITLLSNCLISAKDCKYPLKSLGDELLGKSEEIKTDYRHCFDSVGNWLKFATENIKTKESFIKSTENEEFKNKQMVLNKILSLLNEKYVPYSMKHFLISCLQNIDNVQILSLCIPILYSHIALFKNLNGKNEDIVKVIDLLLKKFTPKTACSLISNSNETKALLHCLNCVINRENDTDRTVQMLTLNILNKEFFSCISSVTVQQEILENLLNIYMTSPDNTNTNVEEALRELCSYSHLFIKNLQNKELTSKSTTLREAKKSKIQESNLEGCNIFDSGPWKKITVFLELMQGENNLLKTEVLIPELFNLLHKSLDYDSQASVEYIKQLIMSTIYSCCEQLSVNAKRLENDFRVELIIQCMRSSTNPVTHRQALLLLNLAAALFPDYVLKNAMSIFVFMGSSLVRQDDSYSCQVISQTIETIIPPLLEDSKQQIEADEYEVVASVIRVFVNSLADIPSHRQLPLFTKLITTLGPSKYLWIPLGQICDQYAAKLYNIATDDNNWRDIPALEFSINLHKQFSPDLQIDTCINLVNHLQTIPDTKKQFESNPNKYKKIKEPFNAINCNDMQLQMYKHNVLFYMKIWLTQEFLSQVYQLSMKQQSDLEEKYELLLESVLGLLQERLSIQKYDKGSLQLNNQVKLLYDLVHAVNSLLPSDLFIRVIRQLLKNKEEEIQMRSLELLITKLEEGELLDVENKKSLLKLQRPLLLIVNTCLSKEDNEKENIVIQQTALYALHLLCKLIGLEYPTKFYKVLNVSVAILSNCDAAELKVNALLCIAQLCHCLNVDILPHLNTFMPVILNILQDESILNMSECLILGLVSALYSIIENLGVFLSSYMEDIVICTCIYSDSCSKLSKRTVLEAFLKLQTKLANEIPLRVLFIAVESSYSKLSRKNVSSIVPLIKILTYNLNCSKFEDILSCATQLQQFYISLLDFRNSNQFPTLETISLVENSIISSLQEFVLKLPATRFRTFFQKLYQWATVSNDDQESKQRIFTFYKLTNELSKTLKSLFSPMSKYLFIHVSSVLDSTNISKSKVYYFDSDINLSHELLVNVLDTLKYCFMYAEEQLLDKENFDLLMHPLVDQIENCSDERIYQDLIENHLNSSISYFISSVSDNALWKSLNYQILLKTRHESPKVRFGALQVLLEVVNKMGDNYLVLLPESIPFLAEIMEDESAEVEQECQTLIIEMEKMLGEPIRKYF